MADPTSVVNLVLQQDTDRATLPIKNAEALVKGGHVSLNESTGKVEFSGENSHVPCGFVLGASSGDDDDLTGNSGGTNFAVIRGGVDVQVSVTGVSAITDVGDDVFATDGQTFNLTNPGTLVAAGYVKKHVSGTIAIVHFYSYNEAKLKA